MYLLGWFYCCLFSNVLLFSHSVMPSSLSPHGLQHTKASLSFTTSRSMLKLISIESVMPSNHLILCRPLLLLPPIFPSIKVFSNDLAFCIKWPKYWSFSEQNKTLCTPGPRERSSDSHKRPRQTCMSVSYRGMGQHWPAVGTQALVAADQGGTARGISPPGGGPLQPRYRATEQTTHKLQNNYADKVLTLMQKF